MIALCFSDNASIIVFNTTTFKETLIYVRCGMTSSYYKKKIDIIKRIFIDDVMMEEEATLA